MRVVDIEMGYAKGEMAWVGGFLVWVGGAGRINWGILGGFDFFAGDILGRGWCVCVLSSVIVLRVQ